MDLLPPEEYAAQLNRKYTSAGVLFRDMRSRVLLVETSYKPDWEIPGGVGEADEPPWTTASREVREELGLDRPPGRLLVIDHRPAAPPMPEGLAFIFDGGTVTEADVASVRLSDPEIVSVGLFTMDEAAERLIPVLASRIRAALQAQLTDTVSLCEAGRPVVTSAPGLRG
ncbi:NUDIX hydrolase [Kutzneria sp. NPDC051319]|uniref:NUDIX hydrolase n=1 Tax=Kutzneria sp. NPDC051319 TaxID=3155047 RepID=UPI003412B720